MKRRRRLQYQRGGCKDESRRITSKSAIKMCIKMSKNIYLHKVGHERMRQQLTEKEREGAREGQRGRVRSSTILYHIYIYIIYIQKAALRVGSKNYLEWQKFQLRTLLARLELSRGCTRVTHKLQQAGRSWQHQQMTATHEEDEESGSGSGEGGRCIKERQQIVSEAKRSHTHSCTLQRSAFQGCSTIGRPTCAALQLQAFGHPSIVPAIGLELMLNQSEFIASTYAHCNTIGT